MSIDVRPTAYANFIDGTTWNSRKTHDVNYIDELFTNFTSNGVLPTYDEYLPLVTLTDDPAENAEIIKAAFRANGDEYCQRLNPTSKDVKRQKILENVVDSQIHRAITRFEDDDVKLAFLHAFGVGLENITPGNAGIWWALNMHHYKVISDSALFSILFCMSVNKTRSKYLTISKTIIWEKIRDRYKKFIKIIPEDAKLSPTERLRVDISFMIHVLELLSSEEIELYRSKKQFLKDIITKYCERNDYTYTFEVQTAAAIEEGPTQAFPEVSPELLGKDDFEIGYFNIDDFGTNENKEFSRDYWDKAEENLFHPNNVETSVLSDSDSESYFGDDGYDLLSQGENDLDEALEYLAGHPDFFEKYSIDPGDISTALDFIYAHPELLDTNSRATRAIIPNILSLHI